MKDPLARAFDIRPAVRTPSFLMLGLVGPSGSGKTFSALRLATGLREIVGGDIVLVDTENGRAKAYADRFKFKHLAFDPPFGSTDYLDALRTASACKPSVIIIDSLTHEHEGVGGLLDFYGLELERLAGDDPSPSQRLQLSAWRRPKQARRQLIAGLLHLNVHIICCFRAAERTRTQEGQSDAVEWGFAAIAGQEFVYELNVCALLRPGARGKPTWASDRPGEALVIKLPQPFEAMFAKDEALSEAHGVRLGQWALGETAKGLARNGRVDRVDALAMHGPASRRRRQSKPVSLLASPASPLMRAEP